MGLFDAVGDLASTLFTNHSNRKLTEQQWARDDNAVQRNTADMRAAGLNPILSAKLGGSSSPPGSAAHAVPTQATSAAIQASLAKGQIELQQAQVEDTNAAKELKVAQTGDIAATQLDRVNLLIAQKIQAMEAGNLSVEGQRKIKQEILNLQAQRNKIRLDSAHSAAQLHKEEVKGTLWEGIKSIPRRLKAEGERRLQDVHDKIEFQINKRKGGK